jgi:5-oxoprolinase (ATP-hydrolysing)
MKRWTFLIDRGGTFTDLIGIDPETHQHHLAKVLSSDAAPVIGIRQILGLDQADTIPACDVRMGTTLATNALLERRGRDCALVISRGFGDLLEIGTQARPEIFELDIKKPTTLYSAVLEVDARCDAAGRATAVPNPEEAERGLRSIRERGITSVAIVLLHGYVDGALERELGELARRAGFEHVSLSHELAAEMGLLRRGDTAVLDAYLTPLLADYFRWLREQLPGSELLLMQSSGELSAPELLRGPACLLSGPAGGVVATREVARVAGQKTAVGFDMGGTSTDVCRVGEQLATVYEATTAGVRVVSPMLDIHTVAAGGGSLCRFDGHALSVGPQSAGAEPGPVCYGNPTATELTLTDVNLLLGRLQADRFPFTLDRHAAERALDRLWVEVKAKSPKTSRDEIADGLLRIANDNMARAIAQVSLARGFDVRDDALVVFGGAGGQHACALAKALSIRTIVFHPLGGVLSALGMGLAKLGRHEVKQVGPLTLTPAALASTASDFELLEQRNVNALAKGQDTPGPVTFTRSLDLRYVGTEASLTVATADYATSVESFRAAHQRRYGYVRADHPVELVTLRVEATAGLALERDPLLQAPSPQARANARPQRTARVFCGRWFDEVPVLEREALLDGQSFDGPLLVLEATGTIVIDPGFRVRVLSHGLLVAEPTVERRATLPSAGERPDARVLDKPKPDPVTLEIIGNAFMSIAEQMGSVLGRTAVSTNIRERLDFSCAVFDRHARLIANAPHIPVHLGAMSESVADLARRFPTPEAGDVFISNDPSSGGSHLPDITVVTPVFINRAPLFYAACRGHHADVGGTTPGSMPPFSSRLEEEGVVFAGSRIVHRGEFDRAGVFRILTEAPHPARYPDQNIADLQAQIAANQIGVGLLTNLVTEKGGELVVRYVEHLHRYAADRVLELCQALPQGSHRFVDSLDDGTPLGVQIDISNTGMHVTFAHTDEHPGNANAPRAVVVAGVLYVLRCLVGRGLPLNGGCLQHVRISVPERSLLCPSPGRAVSSGNVETSQRIVDVLLGALGAASASQGTMNNVTFGNSAFAYYETIGGGAGAGPNYNGASGVQVHMTNTRITDPEVLEQRTGVRLLRFELRRGSGGAGNTRGGDGLVREFEFQQRVTVSLVTERRNSDPFGLEGGAPGARGENSLNGAALPGRHQFEAVPGDRLVIATPGGGGFGPAGTKSDESSARADARPPAAARSENPELPAIHQGVDVRSDVPNRPATLRPRSTQSAARPTTRPARTREKTPANRRAAAPAGSNPSSSPPRQRPACPCRARLPPQRPGCHPTTERRQQTATLAPPTQRRSRRQCR